MSLLLSRTRRTTQTARITFLPLESIQEASWKNRLLIKNRILNGCDPAQAPEQTNSQLCYSIFVYTDGEPEAKNTDNPDL